MVKRVKPLSLRAFARAQGLTLAAVQLAITTGRLGQEHLGRIEKGGWRVILDPVKAAAALDAHTRPRIDSRKQNGHVKPSSLAAATLRERIARAESFELETARKKGLLVPADGVERLVVGIIVQARTALTGLPTRARQLLPHLTNADVVVLDRLVREILEEMADGVHNGHRRAG